MSNTITVKIKNLIKNSHRFDHMQFRLLLEDMVKEGGKEAENFISYYVTSEDIDSLTRINIIRIMGYVTSPTFLVPLKKVLEGQENLNLRKAAIISISKYNDKRALNMLNNALTRINNPILQDSISTEISRIKKDNPILGLLPKFLNAVNDPKTFRTTLEVLKKVLNPKDAHVFIYHLKSDIPFVGDGAFEILCSRGDETVKFSLFDYFRKKLKEVPCIEEEECYSMVHLISQLANFVMRNPETINYILKDIKDLYRIAKDPEIKDVVINIISSSSKREVLSSLDQVFNREEARRDMVIEKLTGNDSGAYILLYYYKKEEFLELKEKLLRALITTQTGSNYIMETFDELSPGYQNLVLENIDTSNYCFFIKLIERFLLSKEYKSRRFALEKMRQNRDSAFHTILFDKKFEGEFLRMHQDYLPTISLLYPLKTFRFFVERVIELDVGRALLGKYFDSGNPFRSAEGVVTIDNPGVLGSFADKLAKFNNKELGVEVFTAFYHLKTFDQNTLFFIQNMVDDYKALRGARLSPAEKAVLNKVNSNLLNISSDLKEIKGAANNINRFMEKSFPDYELLEYLLKGHFMAFFVHREQFIDRIKKTFKLTNELDAFDSIKFLLKQNKLAVFCKEEIKKSTQSSNYLLKQDAEKLLEEMPGQLRIVLIFKRAMYYSYFRDQFDELLPEVTVVNDIQPEADDILLTDTASMEELISENRVTTKRLYVMLRASSEFSDLKDYNPKVFPPPFSLYKVLKGMLVDLYYTEPPKTEDKKR